MQIKTGNHGFLRRQNMAGVFQLLYENAPVSRIELARLTRLNKATVTNLVGELLRHEFVREVGETASGRAGRREVLLAVNPRRGCLLSAEIGVGFISVVCTNFASEIIWRERRPIENFEPGFVLRETVKLLEKARAFGEKNCGRLEGIAVGIPGLIDQKSGTLLLAPNLNWRGVEVLPFLEKHFKTRLFIDNEATFAALGEKFFGAAKGYHNVLYISAGVGIGGGLIINGQLYNGASGYASEFGHMTMDREGIACACGNVGCWETQASLAALFRAVRAALAEGKTSMLGDVAGEDAKLLSAQTIVEAARANDAVALESLGKIGSYLGIGIDSLIKSFNPELVVFGGILSLASEFLVPVIEEEIAKRGLIGKMDETPIVPAHFGSDAAVMGGIAKIFQTILADPIEKRL